MITLVENNLGRAFRIQSRTVFLIQRCHFTNLFTARPQSFMKAVRVARRRRLDRDSDDSTGIETTACSALCARYVRPSFIFVICASGSCGFSQSSMEPFLRAFGQLRQLLSRRRFDSRLFGQSSQKLFVRLTTVTPHNRT